MRRYLLLFATLFCAALWLMPHARAQENATVTGTVTDTTGAVVPNVQITLTNPSTGQVRTAVSNTSGLYLFANVGVGHFSLSATSTGFLKYTKTDLVVNTD